MNETDISKYITETYENVRPAGAWGDIFFYYNPTENLPDEIYFATLKASDDDYDKYSNLNRPEVFRLSIGVSKPTYISLFGQPSQDQGAFDSRFDYTVLDQLMPHPVYGRIFWVCILNPGDETFRETVTPLLDDAYNLAVEKFGKRSARK
jgi:hypothetical protein